MSDIKFVVGLDESGCGALAGPLIVAAVAFPVDAVKVAATWKGIKADKVLVAGDSKKIKLPAQRAVLAEAIRAASPAVAVIERAPKEIDARLLGTVFPEAVQLAAARCLERLQSQFSSLTPNHILLLVDGDLQRPNVPCLMRMIPGGDALDWRIGAASIIAKACHDKHVDQLIIDYPRWEFDKHRGYPTPAHKDMLNRRGLLEDVHRKSFKPVRQSRGAIPGFEE
jgi:ribonuclease HII